MRNPDFILKIEEKIMRRKTVQQGTTSKHLVPDLAVHTYVTSTIQS